MSNNNNTNTEILTCADLYPRYKDMVIGVARSFKKKFPDEEVQDLSQDCWEKIVKKYSKYESSKASLSTWITVVSRNALLDKLRAQQADKRAIRLHSSSLEELVEKYGDKL